MTRGSRWLVAALFAACSVPVGSLAACSYSSSRLVSIPGVRTVAVMQFDNKTYYRDLEMRITRAVAEEVRARTPWTIDSPKSADVLLAGEVRTAEQRVLVEDDNEDELAKRFRVVVDCRLIERSSGRVLRTWSVTAREEFGPNKYGETLNTSVTDTIARSLAQEVVQGLETPIGDPNAAPPPFKPRKLVYGTH